MGNRYYTRQPSYYYSSGYSHHRYGKREAMEVSQEELTRFKREIEEQFNSGAWFLEMMRRARTIVPRDLFARWPPRKNPVTSQEWRQNCPRHSDSETPSTCPALKLCSTWRPSLGS